MNKPNFKVSISASSEAALKRMQTRVNDQALGAKLTKSELASWLITNSENKIDKYVDTIRKEHFSSVNYLQVLLEKKRKAEKDGQACPEFDALAAKLSPPSRAVKREKPTGPARADSNE